MNKIVLISGDPNSINSEIIYKTWKKLNKSLRRRIYIISNYDLLKEQFSYLKYPIKINKINNIYEKTKSNQLNILSLKLKFKKPFNVTKNEASKFVLKSLNYAHSLAVEDKNINIINCPISKNLLKKNKIGVTEYLAKKCKLKDNSEVMVIKNKTFAVSPITTHIDVSEISKKINSKIICKKIFTIHNWYKNKFKSKPRIGVLGLNPHNAELRKNSEERRVIIPSVLKLKKRGVNVNGPLVADTIFINEYKNYDLLVGMYHDQVLSPFKALFNFDAINITLGLKYIRVSPDHGTAVNLIGKKRANPSSLINCVNFLDKIIK